MPDRIVRFHENFFDDLDQQLPQNRSAEGVPSATDFLLHELPRLRDLLASDFHRNTMPAHGFGPMRILVQGGSLVRGVALYVAASEAEVLVLSIEIQLFD